MRFNSRILPGVAIVATGVLAGCGGGGGDDGGSKTTALQLDPANYGEQPAAIRNMSDLDAATSMYQDVSEIQAFVSDVGYALGSTTVSAAATTTAASELCSVENGNLKVTEELGETGEHYEYRFDNCVVPNYTPTLLLDGYVVMDIQVSSDVSKMVMAESYNISGKLGAEQMPIGIVGKQTMTAVMRSETDMTIDISTPALEYLYGDQYTALRDSRISMALKGDTVSLSMNSQLVGSALNGYLTVTTPTAIVGNQYTDCPSSGHMKVEGDGVVEVRYGSNTATGTGTEVLLNGSQVEYYDGCPVDMPLPSGGVTVLDLNGSADKTVALPAQ